MFNLLPHQEANVAEITRLLQSQGVSIDNGGMGTGKTVTACAVVNKLDMDCFVICPKSAIPNWEFTTEVMGVNPKLITNWEQARRPDWQIPQGALALIDEAQRAKSPSSKQGRLLERISDVCPVHMMSGTLYNGALDVRALAHATRVCHTSNFYNWLPSIGGWQNEYQNFRWCWNDTSTNIAKLRACFDPFIVKTDWNDISGLQKNIVQADLVGVSDARRINSIYKDLSNAGSIGELQTLRKEVEGFRVEPMLELAGNFLSEGNSTIAFFNFTDPLLHFARETGCEVINGQTTVEERKRIIEEFQTSDHPKTLACNIKAGGEAISLHDVNGIPRRTLLSPTWSSFDLVQALYRARRVGGKSTVVQKICFAGNTVEERVMNIVRRKLHNLDALSDSDLSIPTTPSSEALAA